MPVDDEAREIARGLTKAQQEALMWLGAKGTCVRSLLESGAPQQRSVLPLEKQGLVVLLGWGRYGVSYRGRAALEAMEKNDARP